MRLELRRLELGELPVEAGGGGLAGASAVGGWDRSQHRFVCSTWSDVAKRGRLAVFVRVIGRGGLV